ncbi:MAG: T9SS type A sorting domain-containing protein [Chitinophagaceae bacterium]|nr:MAG: T9SS type A sorting domain-containing protein [Chitinophagaceae bacterium]
MKKTLPVLFLLRLRMHALAMLLLFTALLAVTSTHAQTVTTGKSYINITRPGGGTFLPGDILEIRATIAVTGGSNSNTTRLNSVRYNDTINTAKLDYVPGSLKMISNEGRTQFTYTDNADADSANVNAVNGMLRFNIGDGASAADVSVQGEATTNAGRLWGGNYFRPSFYGNTCIRVYAYRVQIKTAASAVAVDTTVILRAGNFRYRMGSGGTDLLSNFTPYQMRITPDYGLCNNAIGTNAILGEMGGTFGFGLTQNRAGGSAFVPPPYSYLPFASGTPNDNFYGLANRTSANGSSNPNAAMPGPARVFNVWDIIGDHTGAANPLAGNPPTNTGYAVIINASYETNRAFTQTISNLCEETYYEFSAWFRNICRRCGCDSTGKGAGSAGFVPAPGNDSSGVRPNLTFQIDGQDCYTTGNLAYTGQWIKKGFIFRTRPGQTSFTVTIRNNAPGGGGNDWAIDDIGVATCMPSMQYSPSLTPSVCRGNALTITDTVRSFFNNYTYHRWQRSTDGGSNWFDIGSILGPVSTIFNGLFYQYTASYTVPPAQTTTANSNDKYRLLVGTSLLNLLNLGCRSTDATNAVTLNVVTCDPVLDVEVVHLSGALVSGKTQLKWTVQGVDPTAIFHVEKSMDGSSFGEIGTVGAVSVNGRYAFTDPVSLQGRAWYRLRTGSGSGSKSYTRVLAISDASRELGFATVVNPFSHSLAFDIVAPRRAGLDVTLLDASGRPVRSGVFEVQEGANQLSFTSTGALVPGMYILRVELDGKMIFRKVMKQ